MRPTAVATIVAALLLTAACTAVPTVVTVPLDSRTARHLHPEILATIPHDRSAFTEGFEIAPRSDDGAVGTDGVLYEGTGLAGESELRELDPVTGTLRRAVDLPGSLFGEGIAVVGPRIWQLTYQDGVALEWDRATLTVLRQVPIRGEGWGLCFADGRLVQSDGTDRLRFRDPETFAETGGLSVTLDGRPLTELNELECVDGEVWANVWRTDQIVEIDPGDGRVLAVVDATGLLDPAQSAGTDVLNGIAAVGPGEFLLTGKFWPTTFRVRFVPGQAAR